MSGEMTMDQAIEAVILANPNANLTSADVRERAKAMISRHQLATLEQAMENVRAEQAAAEPGPDESHGLWSLVRDGFAGR